MIHVVYCIDKYLQDKIWPSYNSCLYTKEKVQAHIFCLDGVDDTAIDKYKAVGMNVYLMKTDLQIKLNDNFVKSPAMYLRFYIPEVLKDIDKVIYMECDSVYDGDIKDHWNSELGNNLIATVPDWFSYNCGKLMRWSGHIDDFHDYKAYLTGNMLINCEAWRKESITEKLVNIVSENNIRVNLSMSIVCQGRVKELSDRFCYPANYKYGNENVLIYHWSGKNKPWAVKCKNQNIWEKYAV